MSSSRPQSPEALPTIPGVEDLQAIGRGGFGVVYRGRQPDLAREVAVKVVMSPTAQESAVERWRKEIAAMGRLSNHPNIVTVYSGGLTDGGLPYLVMPYVPGGSLHDRLRDGGPLPPAEVAELGSKLAGALAAAHAVGVLHRDVKPDNVLLSPYGEPQLTDFGIARLLDTTTTAAGTVHATIRYAAPEVLSGQPATEASDVYGLGATLYACLTGEAPFADTEDASIVALVGRIASETPGDLRERGVPDELARAVESALAKAPADRLGTDELQRRLDSAAAASAEPGRTDTTVAARTVPMPSEEHERTAAIPVTEAAVETHSSSASAPATAPAPAARVPRASRSSRSDDLAAGRGWGTLAALGVLVAGLAALLLVVTRNGDPPNTSTTGASAVQDAPQGDGEPDATSRTSRTSAPDADGVAGALSSRAKAYFEAIRVGRLEASYGMLSPEFRRVQSRNSYDDFWAGKAVTIEGPVRVDEEALAATVPLTVDGRREDFRLTFVRAGNGTWYVDGPRPG